MLHEHTLAIVKAFPDLPDETLLKDAPQRVLFGCISDEEHRRGRKEGIYPPPRKQGGGRTNFNTVGEVRAALAKLRGEAV